ncbi:MAG: uroporphyrinogen decarboxylase [Chloroflexi bacterium]|jgi:uroporphyrinogen decarboxylase|nr:uroporphyrinogen decarboxylase [Chloroflexota bacterium]
MIRSKLSHRARLEACLSQGPLDRPPVALWRHFPVDDQTPEGLAAATLAFQRTYDWDLVKVTPASSYCLRDWGAVDVWQGATEGTRAYTRRIIQHPDDWTRLPVLDPTAEHLAAQIACLRLIVQEAGPETPVIQTIFNPLAQAKNLVGGQNLLVHLRHYPDQLHAGLATITETTRRFIEALRDTGIAGIFYAVQHAQYSLLSQSEYEAFGKVYDMQLLEPARDFWLNMLHLHGTDVMFDLFRDYSIDIINWHDRETFPSLVEGKLRFPGVVCGGLRREETMVLGTPEQVQNEAHQAIQATGGTRFILGTGCVVPITAPHGNLMAARQSVENYE